MNTGKGVIISTWNISECVSTQWDMQNGLDEPLFANQFEPLLEEIISRINESKSDVVCFQEFPIVINNKYSLINEIKQKTNLKYCVTLDTCPSFLFYGGRIGIALFSRTRILQTNFSFFKNPNFLKVSKNGAVYKSFDKGIIIAKLRINDISFTVVTGHAIGFSPFDEVAENYPESYKPLLDIVRELYLNNHKIVVVGDFNTELLFDILPELSEYVIDKLEGRTTITGLMEGNYYPNGRKLDYFLVSEGINVKYIKKIDNFSDHLLCVAHCNFIY